jgi:hypothetical protein
MDFIEKIFGISSDGNLELRATASILAGNGARIANYAVTPPEFGLGLIQKAAPWALRELELGRAARRPCWTCTDMEGSRHG